MNAYFRFYSIFFQTLADSEEAQICILHNVFELWRSHQQMMVVIIDKLLKTQIVECSAVATWIFSKEMTSEFTKMYLWEILHLTIKKMNKHVIKLGKWIFFYNDLSYGSFVHAQYLFGCWSCILIFYLFFNCCGEK